jgi:formate--tetrahydrofolate ligase
MAMSYADYVVTEAGFGADLGAEKFFDIKCRKSGLQPKLTVIVTTTQGLKMHGGVPVEEIKEPNIEGLTKGFDNLDRHIRNLKGFGQSVVVAFNRFDTDTEEEIELLRSHCESIGVGFAINNAFYEGGEGAKELAQLVIDTVEQQPSHPLTYTYADTDSIKTKVEKVCRKIYGAASVSYGKTAEKSLLRIQKLGLEHYPVCIAKTQFSFSADKKLYGCPTGFNIKIRDFVINTGAEMIVAIAGDIMRMPGLAKSPQAERITLNNGQIEGLS